MAVSVHHSGHAFSGDIVIDKFSDFSFSVGIFALLGRFGAFPIFEGYAESSFSEIR
jgi:hypothetical protein